LGAGADGDARQGVRRPVPRDRLFLRETAAILAAHGVERSHQAIFQWVHQLTDSSPDPLTAKPSRIAADETAVRINGDLWWVYAAIDLDTKLILDARIFKRHGTDPAAAFLHRLRENHDCGNTTFLTDSFGYRTVLNRLGLSGQVDYTDRNLIEKWFHMLKQRIDRFHQSWVGSRRSVRRWISHYVQYYNEQRPDQALDEPPPAEEVRN
jgi:putative transposase